MTVDYLSLAALLISLSSVGLGIIKFRKESKIQVQTDLVTTLAKIIEIIRNNTIREYRLMLRKNKILNSPISNSSIPNLDDETEKAARYVAVVYDKLLHSKT